MKTESERKIEHSAPPFEIDKRSSCAVKDATGRMVASTAVHTSNRDDGEHAEVNEANAAFIVKACNSHDALVEALKSMLKEAGFDVEAIPEKDLYQWRLSACVAQARAALKLAGKEGE